jgi:hypothetical protein
MAFLLQPMVIAALGLLGALGALAWSVRLGRKVDRLRYRLSSLERQVGRSEQQGVGLSQELSRLKAELAQCLESLATPRTGHPGRELDQLLTDARCSLDLSEAGSSLNENRLELD